VKRFKIGSFRQEACAGAPAPPGWNVCSARALGLWILGRDTSGSFRFNLFAASGAAQERRVGLVPIRQIPQGDRRTMPLPREDFCYPTVLLRERGRGL